MKKIIALSVSIIILFCGCGRQEINSNSKYSNDYEVALVRTSNSSSDKTDIVFLNDKLKTLRNISCDYGNVGDAPYSIPCVSENKVYMYSLGYGVDQDNCNVLSLSLENGDIEEYPTERAGITDIEVDSKYIYMISNLNGDTYIDKIDKKSKSVTSLKAKKMSGTVLFLMKGKAYSILENSNKESNVYKFDFDSKKITLAFKLGDEYNQDYEPYYYCSYNDKVYVPYKDYLYVISEKDYSQQKIKLPDNTNQAFGVYKEEDQLYISSCDTIGVNDKSTITQYDLEKEKIVCHFTINTTIAQFNVKDDKLFILTTENEIQKYSLGINGKCDLIAKTEIDATNHEYLSGMFCR